MEEGGKQVETGKYQRLILKLTYLLHTRLDISFAINVCTYCQKLTYCCLQDSQPRKELILEED